MVEKNQPIQAVEDLQLFTALVQQLRQKNGVSPPGYNCMQSGNAFCLIARTSKTFLMKAYRKNKRVFAVPSFLSSPVDR